MTAGKTLQEKIKKVKLLISDVDGVLTDGHILVGSDGTEFKRYTVVDGVGVALARLAGLKLAFLSGRYSEATTVRIKELGLEEFLWQGKLNKIDSYMEIKERFALKDEEIAYIGDDLIDLPVLKAVGFSVTVNNATEEVKSHVDYITRLPGGEGAFREVVDLILKTQDIYNSVVQKMRITVYNEKV